MKTILIILAMVTAICLIQMKPPQLTITNGQPEIVDTSDQPEYTMDDF